MEASGWSIPRSYQWILFLVLIVVGVGFIYYLPESGVSKSKPRTETQISEPKPTKTKETPSANNSVSLTPDFYPQVSGQPFNEVRLRLQKKGREVQKLLPSFPIFPDTIPRPPKDKGEYSSIGERHMVEFLDTLFPGHKFCKIRPHWLRNDRTNYPLEIDGYSKELNLGAEYNGIQHYVWPNWTKQSYEDFTEQLHRDSLKMKTFQERKECLIVISYLIPYEEIPIAVYCKLLESVPGVSPYL